MSPNPLDHVAGAHRKIRDAHQGIRDAHRAARGKSASGGTPEIREQLIDAAEKLLAERPVTAITTRDITRAAGLSDGVLYNYFADKNDLVVAALVRRFDAQVMVFETDLPEPGSGDVDSNLVVYAEAWLRLENAILPGMIGLLVEPDLAHRFFAQMHADEAAMSRVFGRVAGYLVAEQERGRLGPFDVTAAATLLGGAVMGLGMAGMADGRSLDEASGQIRAIVRTMLDGLAAG